MKRGMCNSLLRELHLDSRFRGNDTMLWLQCGAAHQSRDMSCRGQRQMIGVGGKR